MLPLGALVFGVAIGYLLRFLQQERESLEPDLCERLRKVWKAKG